MTMTTKTMVIESSHHIRMLKIERLKVEIEKYAAKSKEVAKEVDNAIVKIRSDIAAAKKQLEQAKKENKAQHDSPQSRQLVKVYEEKIKILKDQKLNKKAELAEIEKQFHNARFDHDMFVWIDKELTNFDKRVDKIFEAINIIHALKEHKKFDKESLSLLDDDLLKLIMQIRKINDKFTALEKSYALKYKTEKKVPFKILLYVPKRWEGKGAHVLTQGAKVSANTLVRQPLTVNENALSVALHHCEDECEILQARWLDKDEKKETGNQKQSLRRTQTTSLDTLSVSVSVSEPSTPPSEVDKLPTIAAVRRVHSLDIFPGVTAALEKELRDNNKSETRTKIEEEESEVEEKKDNFKQTK